MGFKASLACDGVRERGKLFQDIKGFLKEPLP
jgi:hypothetical protein